MTGEFLAKMVVLTKGFRGLETKKNFFIFGVRGRKYVRVDTFREASEKVNTWFMNDL